MILKPIDNAIVRIGGDSPGRSASEREVASKLKAKKVGVPRPILAAFGSTDEEQRLMSPGDQQAYVWDER